MADSTSETAAIYRLTSSGQTESSIVNGESLGLDYGINENSDGGIVSFRGPLDNRKPDIGSPDQQVQRKPDTGVFNFQVEIDIQINEKISDSEIEAKLIKFGLDGGQTVRGVFSKGRIGLRNDKNTLYNVVPNNTEGYKLISIRPSDNITYGGDKVVTVILQHVGKNTQIIANADAIIT